MSTATSEGAVLDHVDEARITGATIVETVAEIVYVDALSTSKNANGSQNSPFNRLEYAFKKAEKLINTGVPTKIVIAPGEYREKGIVLSTNEIGKETLLIIEGDKVGGVVISGSDLYAPSEWKSDKNGIALHPLKEQFGNFAYFWEGHNVISHRSEQVFVNDQPLRQKLLENYRYQINVKDQITEPKGFKPNEWHYTGYTKPEEILSDNTFGVAEKFRNGKKLAIKLSDDIPIENAKIEVSVRREFLKLEGEKNNLIFRNLVFCHFANSTDDTTTGAVIFGKSHAHILIENCDFLWNNAFGLHFRNISGLTVRNCRFNYNGASGIGMSTSDNVIFDRVQTNYNCWKVFWGGQIDWYTAGAKIHETNNMLYLDSEAIGNTCPGIWYDVHCKNIVIRGCFAAFNTRNIFVELSNGPYLIDRLVSVFGKHYSFYTSVVGRTTLRDSLLYNNGYGTVAEVIWFERNDEHSLRQNLQTKYHRFSGSVFASGSYHTFLLGDRNFLPLGTPNQKTFAYYGSNNHFFHPNAGKNFYYLNQKREFVQCTFEEWQKGKKDYSTEYQEENPSWGNPQFNNPDQLDFTLASGSPLARFSEKVPFNRYDPAILQRTKDFFSWCGWDQVLPSPAAANQLPRMPFNVRARFISEKNVLLEWDLDPTADGVVLENEWDGQYVWRNEFSKTINTYVLSFCNIENPQRYKLYAYNSVGYSESTEPIVPETTEFFAMKKNR